MLNTQMDNAWVICNKILYNSSLVLAKLKRHLETNYPQLKEALHAGVLDESTDVAGLAVLIVIVKNIFEESIEEDLLLCTPLDTNATGEEMFKIVDCYMLTHDLDWH
ncbi:hypothetical protein PR048_026878 [Dryococelus australis]|uniref:Uncharacterized protein n=1 Tax=Dryococelus australis TaxID=614101 RepID=A0ABQ9GMJ0_9NEOP|nr:hypothetical protein PR048_026878 [Dryococelus australis]